MRPEESRRTRRRGLGGKLTNLFATCMPAFPGLLGRRLHSPLLIHIKQAPIYMTFSPKTSPNTRYPSNLTDMEWERLKPLTPEAAPGGRPRKTDMRAAMNAIFSSLRTGCPWRYLPGDEFPPRSTVCNIFRKFQ